MHLPILMGKFFSHKNTIARDWTLNKSRKYNSYGRLFFMGLFILFMVIADVSATIQNTVNVVEGIVGGIAKLQCKSSQQSEDENPILVLWYKDWSRRPFFTLDMRDGGPTEFFDDEMRSRVRSDVTGEFLTLNSLILSDSGHYKCKADYQNSPSMEVEVQLIVYEPPEEIMIRDEMENTLTGPTLGPINQDSRLRLFCIAIGGVPPPTVSWWSGSNQLTNKTVNLENIISSVEDDYRSSRRKSVILRNNFVPGNFRQMDREHKIVVAELNIIKVARKDSGTNLTCIASNNNISQRLEMTIALNIHLRPKTVKIIHPKNHLRENTTANIKCEATGSYPIVKIIWEKNRNEKPTTFEPKQINLKSNESESWFRFIPKAEDHKGRLTCKAHNPNLPGKATSDFIVLNVHYLPRVTLKIGKNIVHQSIKEADDVYFECEISSNPRVTLITWHRNGIPVVQKLKSGILLSGKNLVLQRIHRKSAGNYTCSVMNEIGTTESNIVSLKVMYLPVCDTKQMNVAVAEDEEVKLVCRVAARPSKNLTYVWVFNNTLDTVMVDMKRVVVNGPISYMNYTPVSSRDYGTLSCWATNEVGMQAEPCRFTVVEAGPPGRVKNCVLFNHTVNSLEVQCSPGSNGGSAQSFIAKVFVASTDTLLAELKSKTPKFRVTGLTQGQDYLVTVTAINNKGSSKPAEIDANRLKVAEKRMVDIKSNTSVSPLVGVFLGLVGGFLLLLIIGLLLSRSKINRFPSPSMKL